MFSFVLRMCQCILTSASGCQQRVCWGLCTDGWAGDFSKPNPSVLPGLPVLQTTLIAILYLQHRHTIRFWGKVLGKSLNKGKISYVCWAQLVPAACVGNHRCLLDLHTGTKQTCAVCIVHCTNAFNIRVSMHRDVQTWESCSRPETLDAFSVIAWDFVESLGCRV